MTVDSAWWVGWLVAVVASFGVLEGIALGNRADGDTLSENTRRWIGMFAGTRKRAAGAAAFAGTVLGFAVWFVVHILGG